MSAIGNVNLVNCVAYDFLKLMLYFIVVLYQSKAFMKVFLSLCVPILTCGLHVRCCCMLDFLVFCYQVESIIG